LALGLYAILIVVGAALYSPTLRRQIAAIDASGATSPEYTALQARGTRLGMVLGVLVVVMIGLMVLKPTI
jgi:hypothetical protein